MTKKTDPIKTAARNFCMKFQSFYPKGSINISYSANEEGFIQHFHAGTPLDLLKLSFEDIYDLADNFPENCTERHLLKYVAHALIQEIKGLEQHYEELKNGTD